MESSKQIDAQSYFSFPFRSILSLNDVSTRNQILARWQFSVFWVQCKWLVWMRSIYGYSILLPRIVVLIVYSRASTLLRLLMCFYFWMIHDHKSFVVSFVHVYLLKRQSNNDIFVKWISLMHSLSKLKTSFLRFEYVLLAQHNFTRDILFDECSAKYFYNYALEPMSRCNFSN